MLQQHLAGTLGLVNSRKIGLGFLLHLAYLAPGSYLTRLVSSSNQTLWWHGSTFYFLRIFVPATDMHKNPNNLD